MTGNLHGFDDQIPKTGDAAGRVSHEHLNEDMPLLQTIAFTFRKSLIILSTGTIALGEKDMTVKIERPERFETVEEHGVPYPVSKDEFIHALQDLHLERWKSRYEKRYVLDARSWEIELHFSNGHRARYTGHAAYPDNFNAFFTLIGVNPYKEVE